MAIKPRANPLLHRPPKMDGPEDPKTTRFNFLFEHLCLIVMTGLVCLAFIVWLLAVSTDFWVVVVAGNNGILLSDDDTKVTSLEDVTSGSSDSSVVFLWSYSGLWRRCDVFARTTNVNRDSNDVIANHTINPNVSSHVTSCRHHTFFPSTTDGSSSSTSEGESQTVGQPSKDFVQAELTMVLIALVLMAMAVGFSVYALVHPRYMYKRVAAALHIFTAIVIVVLLSMVKSNQHLAHHEIQPSILEKSQYYYGFSYLLAVTVLMVFIAAGLAFMCLSKKRRNLLYDDADVLLK